MTTVVDLKGECIEVGSSLFYRACMERTEGNSLKLRHWRIRLDVIILFFFSVWVVRHWEQLTQAGAGLTTLGGVQEALG